MPALVLALAALATAALWWRLRGIAARAIDDCYEQAEWHRALAWIEQELAPLLTGPATAMAGPVIVHTLA